MSTVYNTFIVKDTTIEEMAGLKKGIWDSCEDSEIEILQPCYNYIKSNTDVVIKKIEEIAGDVYDAIKETPLEYIGSDELKFIAIYIRYIGRFRFQEWCLYYLDGKIDDALFEEEDDMDSFFLLLESTFSIVDWIQWVLTHRIFANRPDGDEFADAGYEEASMDEKFLEFLQKKFFLDLEWDEEEGVWNVINILECLEELYS